MLIKTEAFVLRSRKYNEADSLLVLFSKNIGKISAIAKGSRRAKSRMLSGIQPFALSEFLLYPGKSLYTVNQVEAKQIYYPLREDYQKLIYASYMVELMETGITEGQTHQRLFALMEKGLSLLSETKVPPQSLLRAFELHFLSAVGYEPEWSGCIQCRSSKSEKWWFDHIQGGLVCEECQTMYADARRVSHTSRKLARYLMNKKLEDLKDLQLHTDLNIEMETLMNQYIRYHMECFPFRSLKMIRELREDLLTRAQEFDTFVNNRMNECDDREE